MHVECGNVYDKTSLIVYVILQFCLMAFQ